MKHSYLEVTYRKGRAVAAYYYLPRQDGDRSARTERIDGGFLVDLTPDGRPIGVEILSPEHVDLILLNNALERLGQHRIGPEDLRPLVAA